MEATFPRAVAGEEVPGVPELPDDLERRGNDIGKTKKPYPYPGAASGEPELNMASIVGG